MPEAKASPTPSAAPRSGAPTATPTQRGANTAPSAGSSAPKPLIAPSHIPTPAQQNPQVRRNLVPTLPEPDPERPAPDPVGDLQKRQKAAIESRLQGHEHAQRGGFGGSPPPPKPPSAASSQSGSPRASSTSATNGATSGASTGATASSQGAPAAKAAGSSASSKTPEGAPSSTANPQTSAPTTTPSEPSDSADGTSSSAASAATSSAAVLSFTPKAFKAWAKANPEEALRFREDIDRDTFRMGEEPKQEWIRQTARARKMNTEFREKQAKADAEMTARETAARQQLELAEKTAGQLRYLTEMWGAFQGKGPNGERVIDFDAADEAFRQNSNGLTFDEYARLRARRGVANPEATRLKAELRRAELELERTRQQTNGAAAASAPGAAQGAPEAVKPAVAAPAAPAAAGGLHENPEEYWDSTLPSDHPLRNLNGWGKLLDHAMLQWQDEDDPDAYSRDVEEIATDVFKRKLAAIGGADPAPAKVAVQPHVRGKPKTPSSRPAARRATAASEDGAPTNVAGVGIPAGKLVPRGTVNTDRSHYEIPREKWGDVARNNAGIENVTRNAIERARLRAQGIDPDTGGPWEG